MNITKTKTAIKNDILFNLDKFENVVNYSITDNDHSKSYEIDFASSKEYEKYYHVVLNNYHWEQFNDSEATLINEITSTEWNKIENIPLIELNATKSEALEALKTNFEAKVNDGYTVDGVGTFAIGEKDLTSFTQRLVLLRELADAGMLPDNTTLKDKDGGMHSLPVVTGKTLILQLGIYADTLWGLYGSKAEAIKNASTLALLDEIELVI